MSTALRVGLAGGRGYGRIHLDRLDRLAREGRTQLVGVADPAGRSDEVPSHVPSYASLTDLLAAQDCDVVIISTPIHTHASLVTEAMRAGTDVYVEKPPMASLADFHEVQAVAAETGKVCQVGFQAVGSHALGRIAELVSAGSLGTVRIVAATGTWSRTRGYFSRSEWAGRRRIGDVVVADGVATNALAHAVAESLRLVAATRLDQVRTVTTELYKANVDNESDDTTFVRVDAADSVPVSCALTLCGSGDDLIPRATVIGDRGRASLHYNEDVLDLELDGVTSTETYARTDLVENLLDHVEDPAVPLLSPLVDNGAYMAVLQAIQDAPEPTDVVDHVVWQGSGEDEHAVIDDIGHWVKVAAESGDGFAAVGAPWATALARTVWRPGTQPQSR